MTGFKNVVKLSKVRKKHLADVAKVKALRSDCLLRYIKLARLGVQGRIHDDVERVEKMIGWWEQREYPNFAMILMLEIAIEQIDKAEKQRAIFG